MHVSCEHVAYTLSPPTNQPTIRPSHDVTLIISLWFIRCTHHHIHSSRSAVPCSIYTFFPLLVSLPPGEIGASVFEFRFLFFFGIYLFIYDWTQAICLPDKYGSDAERVRFLLSACLSIGRRCVAPVSIMLWWARAARSCHPNQSVGLCKASRIYKWLPKCYRAAVQRSSPSMSANEPYKINMRNYISAFFRSLPSASKWCNEGSRRIPCK